MATAQTTVDGGLDPDDPVDSTVHGPDTPQMSLRTDSLPIPHMYPFPSGLLPPVPTRSKRRQVKNACVNCQRACKRCDEARPCLRCVKYGVSEECVDSQRKERKKGVKRGPYKKRAMKGNINHAEQLRLPDLSPEPVHHHVASGGVPPTVQSQYAAAAPSPHPNYYPSHCYSSPPRSVDPIPFSFPSYLPMVSGQESPSHHFDTHLALAVPLPSSPYGQYFMRPDHEGMQMNLFQHYDQYGRALPSTNGIGVFCNRSRSG